MIADKMNAIKREKGNTKTQKIGRPSLYTTQLQQIPEVSKISARDKRDPKDIVQTKANNGINQTAYVQAARADSDKK